tara:strand:+ start:100162 stop:100914 length:753 start_codon:yes stop_codon:yes gene_type:complete
MPNPLKQFFSFSKIERYGFYAVLFLIFISIAVKAYLPEFYKSETTLNYNEEIAQFEKQIKQLEQTNNNQKTAQEKQVSSISKTQTEKRNFTNPKKSIQNTTNYTKSTKNSIKININTADTTEWKKLYGIGKVLSKRIVAFREKLGGFYSVEQLKEVYGLKPETYEQIKPHLYFDENFTIKKLDINNLEAKKLAAHPYIDWDLANLIVAYRKQHNGFKTVYELNRTGLVNEKLYRKLVPYLTVKKYVINEN